MKRRLRISLSGGSISAVGLLMCMLLLSSCALLPSSIDGYIYQIPTETDDGWQTASLEEVGLDTGQMIQLMNDLAKHPDHWVHSMVVIKDGKLVFEEYFPGEDLDLSNLGNGVAYSNREFNPNTLHSAASISKSITSILLGIAIDEGLVQGTQETMFSYFPDYLHLSDGTKSKITLEHMLAMASGLPWSEAYPYDDPRNDLVSMVFSDDPIGQALDRSTAAAPGTEFIYNSGTANLLGEIVRRSSGMTLADFAEQRLFAPLGIETYEW